MSPLEKEIEIIKLEDQKQALGMATIQGQTYEEQVASRAQYRLDIMEINKKITALKEVKNEST